VRGCLFVLVVAAGLGAVVALVGLRPVAAGIIHAGVVASGLSSDDLRVTVDADPPTELLGLHADAVRVRATDARWRDARVGRLEIELLDVALGARTADRIEGRLEDVRFVRDDTDGTDSGQQGALPIALVLLHGGRGEPVVATASLDAATMEAHIAARVRERTGIDPSAVRLEPTDRLAVGLRGLDVGGRLIADAGGSLVLRLDTDLVGDIVLADVAEQPIRFTSVRVLGRTLELAGEVDVAGF